ncbi:MAG TPA: IPT/TIG domain-containing protein [Planctomycetota bacterium]
MSTDVIRAAASPDGRWVVYTESSGADGTLVLRGVAADGEQAPVLLGGPLETDFGQHWTVTSDSAHVVFQAGGLRCAPIDGATEAVRLDGAGAAGEVRDHVLAPGAGRVVYRAAPAGRYPGLYSVALDGRAPPRELVAPSEHGEVLPSYRISTPSGSVVFASHHQDGTVARLYRVPLDGGPVVALQHQPFSVADFELTPDGTHVVYRTPVENARVLELFVLPVDASRPPRRLNVALARGVRLEDFAIHPDGTRVVYRTVSDGGGELHSVPLDGSAPPARLALGAAAGYRFGSGGRWLLGLADPDGDERLELFATAPDGSSEPTRLSQPGEHVVELLCAADGVRERAHVVYRAHRDGRGASELWSVAPEGGARRRLAEVAAAGGLLLGRSHLVYRDPEQRIHALALDGRSAPAELGRAEAAWLDPAREQVLFVGTLPDAAPGEAPGLYRAHLDGAAPPRRLSAPAARKAARAPGGGRSASTVGDVGFRDFSFGLSGNSTPTGEKPESKLWWHDGSWWGSLYDDASTDYRIHRLDLASQTWLDTGTALDPRSSSKADVLWDASIGKLYVASHIFSTNSGPASSSNWGRLFRYSYDGDTRTYTLDGGFPVAITRGTAEALTIARDSTGQLWATWVESARVMVNHSLGGDLKWGTPFVLPLDPVATSVSSDDISAVIAFGTRVGVMWSNQLTQRTYFGLHEDGTSPEAWLQEVVLPDGNCTFACADDLFSLKTDAEGRVLAVIKTSQEGSDQLLNVVSIRAPQGGWSSSDFGLVRDHHTRAILLYDEEHGDVYVFATSPENGGAVYYKSAPLDDLVFEPGVGTPFIRNSLDLRLNNATSTKQNVDGGTGIVVLASDQESRYYLHNFLPIGPTTPAPVIDSFEPTSGPVGTSVTLTGVALQGTSAVRFAGTPAAFTVVSDTRIDATVPAEAASGPIEVTTPGGTATSVGDFSVERPAPSIGSFSPTGGPAGTPVAILGSSFGGASRVTFAGIPAAFTVTSDTRIDATVPDGATSGPIAVTTPGGTATSKSDFTVPPPAPTIGGFDPTRGAVGASVAITGTSFTGATRVTFSGTPAAFTVTSDVRIETTVPDGASSGPIAVTTPSGTATSSSDFTVLPPAPTISSFAPTRGAVGTSVAITGTGFASATRVTFGGASAAFSVASSTRIDASVPRDANSGRITVTNPGGRGVSSGDFTVLRPPTIEAFHPSSGPPGTQVTIAGGPFTGAYSVQFGDAEAAFRVLSPTQIQATVPDGASSVPIRVANPDGVAVSSDPFGIVPVPRLDSFFPSLGTIGTPVTVSGEHFTHATSVAFDGMRALAFTVLDDRTILTLVPPGARSGKIGVSTPDGTGTSRAVFTVLP